MLQNCLQVRWNRVYADESIRLISHKCRNDTKAVTAHLTHWYPTICFLDSILWFGLHFSHARSTKCICESLEEDFRWSCKKVGDSTCLSFRCLAWDLKKICLVFTKLYFKVLWGNWVLKHLRKAPEIKPVIDPIRKFQSDWWIARDVYAQRQPLQLALSRMLFSSWSWVSEACLTACLLETPASASETLIAMQGNIQQSLLPHPSPSHYISLLLCIRIQMFMYFKWLFFPKKMLRSQMMISVFSINIHFDHLLWQVTWVTGLGLPEDVSKLHIQCTWDILHTKEMLQEVVVGYECCLPGLWMTWKEQARLWLSGSWAPSAVPSDETCPYVLAQMSQDMKMHSLLLQQLGVWHLKWC